MPVDHGFAYPLAYAVDLVLVLVLDISPAGPLRAAAGSPRHIRNLRGDAACTFRHPAVVPLTITTVEHYGRAGRRRPNTVTKDLAWHAIAPPIPLRAG